MNHKEESSKTVEDSHENTSMPTPPRFHNLDRLKRSIEYSSKSIENIPTYFFPSGFLGFVFTINSYTSWSQWLEALFPSIASGSLLNFLMLLSIIIGAFIVSGVVGAFLWMILCSLILKDRSISVIDCKEEFLHFWELHERHVDDELKKRVSELIRAWNEGIIPQETKLLNLINDIEHRPLPPDEIMVQAVIERHLGQE